MKVLVNVFHAHIAEITGNGGSDTALAEEASSNRIIPFDNEDIKLREVTVRRNSS